MDLRGIEHDNFYSHLGQHFVAGLFGFSHSKDKKCQYWHFRIVCEKLERNCHYLQEQILFSPFRLISISLFIKGLFTISSYAGNLYSPLTSICLKVQNSIMIIRALIATFFSIILIGISNSE